MTDTPKMPAEAYQGHERCELPLECILVDAAFNIDPRRATDPELVGGLADNIQEHGLLEPLVVVATRANGAKYAIEGWSFHLLAGHVRLAALKRLGWKVAPVVVKRDLTDLQSYFINGAENTSRRQVHPFYVAKRFEFLHTKFGQSYEALARAHNYSASRVESLIKTYQRTVPSIRQKVFENVDVDESRVPAMQWLMSNQKFAPEEQIEKYEAKYGKGRDRARLNEADEVGAELVDDRRKRPQRRSYDALMKAAYVDLAPNARLEIVIKGFEDSPVLTQRERILCKAMAYWALDLKKPYPFRKPKSVVSTRPVK